MTKAQQKQVNDMVKIMGSLDNFKELFFNLLNSNQLNTIVNTSDSQILKFTKKEIDSMPQHFRKEFRAEGCTVRVRKRKISKNAYSYEIRYRRNGYNICVTNKNLETVKKMFLEKLNTAKPVPKKHKTAPSSFDGFATFYFENFRIRKVAKNTYENDMYRYKNHIKPYFEDKPIYKITSLECQDLIDTIVAEGKGKTADEVYSLLNVIFKAAIAHGILLKNPLDIVFHTRHEKKHGKSLTKDEEKLLLSSTEGTEYQLMFAIALYTGMRPNEYETARREGNFIIAKNSKRKGGKTETKKIPITPMLAPYIKDTREIKFLGLKKLREKFNSIIKNHILYDLRTTFYSRCIECGVSEIAQKLFVGHSLGELGNAYTDVSDEFLLREGAKLKY